MALAESHPRGCACQECHLRHRRDRDNPCPCAACRVYRRCRSWCAGDDAVEADPRWRFATYAYAQVQSFGAMSGGGLPDRSFGRVITEVDIAAAAAALDPLHHEAVLASREAGREPGWSGVANELMIRRVGLVWQAHWDDHFALGPCAENPPRGEGGRFARRPHPGDAGPIRRLLDEAADAMAEWLGDDYLA